MKLLLYFHTIVNLKWPQIRYRLPVLRKFGRAVSKERLNKLQAGKIDNWIPSIATNGLYSGGGTFTFLNHSHTFQGEIQWDFTGYGLLWAYNLNYFEYLVQDDIEKEDGFRLIDSFLSYYGKATVGHDPYPISLRLVFWIRFFIKQDCQPAERYLQTLHQQAKELESKLEYHLLGNHLLENAFALFFSGCYLADTSMLKGAGKLLQKQLEEQILPDGGHFELSPMYHQLMLYRLLDCINMGRISSAASARAALPFLEQTAARMLGWMRQMTFKNGSFPLFNDAANGIGPTPADLITYANRLTISPQSLPLNESGYRRWDGPNWEMIFDVGPPGPSYQPGHAHCDALSFVLQVNRLPVIVDTGTSVYGGDPKRRTVERSTAAHNTVQFGCLEQSEIWSEFRMGRKAKVLISEENEEHISACHNGFFFKKNVHTRIFRRTEDTIHIIDEVRNKGVSSSARFHFHPDIPLDRIDQNSFSFKEGLIRFHGSIEVKIFSYDYAPRFGERIRSSGLEVLFEGKLSTEIIPKEL